MTRYAPPERGPAVVILGPCPCSVCGEPLFFAERNTRYNGIVGRRRAWRDRWGIMHRCEAAPTSVRRVA